MTADHAQRLDQLPPTFLEEVQKVLSQLHDNEIVFGDVRSANIMITRINKVKFVDFDWAGKAEASHYPLLLSQQIQWPDGVGGGLAVMEKQHDLDMLMRLPHTLNKSYTTLRRNKVYYHSPQTPPITS
jgi:serine/threonine protein kinase